MKKIVSLLVMALLGATIAFGLLKQFKMAWRSTETMRAVHTDAGASIRRLKQRLESIHAPQRPERIFYLTDRTEKPGRRPGHQYIYDAQYALAPLVLAASEENADYLLFDGEGQGSVERFLATRSDMESFLIEENAALFRRKVVRG